MRKKKKKPRYPDYELVTTKESGVVTFGTNVWIRKDRQALIIVFPAGQEIHFKPEEETGDFVEDLMINDYLP